MKFDASLAEDDYEALIARTTTKFIAPHVKRAKVLLNIVREQVPVTEIVYGMGIWSFRCPKDTKVTIIDDDREEDRVDAESYLDDPSRHTELKWPARHVEAYEELHEICTFLGTDGIINCMEDIT